MNTQCGLEATIFTPINVDFSKNEVHNSFIFSKRWFIWKMPPTNPCRPDALQTLLSSSPAGLVFGGGFEHDFQSKFYRTVSVRKNVILDCEFLGTSLLYWYFQSTHIQFVPMRFSGTPFRGRKHKSCRRKPPIIPVRKQYEIFVQKYSSTKVQYLKTVIFLGNETMWAVSALVRLSWRYLSDLKV